MLQAICDSLHPGDDDNDNDDNDDGDDYDNDDDGDLQKKAILHQTKPNG